MSLAKIPFILVFSYFFHVALISPQPPPSKDELVPTSKWDMPLGLTNGVRGRAATHIQKIIAAWEIATIVAIAFPSWSMSGAILSLLPSGKYGHALELQMDGTSMIGLALAAIGGSIRLWAYHELGRFFRFDISIQKEHALITTGPYSFVRHPSYTGSIIVQVGMVLWNTSRGSWIRQSGFIESLFGKIFVAGYFALLQVYTLLVLLTRTSKEDEALRKVFGKEWDRWAQRVPYSIVPGVY